MNIHTHGPEAIAKRALSLIESARNLCAVALDDYGELSVRKVSRAYSKPASDDWLAGAYRPGVTLEQLQADIEARAAELDPKLAGFARNLRYR